MAEIQTYPSGTPATGDKIPYVADPTGTPALKLASIAAVGAGFDVDGHSGNTLIVTGTTETVLATVARSVASALLLGNVVFSMNEFGVVKTVTFRIRRTNTAGAVIWSSAVSPATDSTTGVGLDVTAIIGDTSPTGTWVLTAQVTAGTGATELWSTLSSLAVIG